MVLAIGLGRIFGFRFPENFRWPYVADTIQEFWRRWHISLSSCLRDYLYIPFGGNRGGEWKTRRNLMLTMLIGGLWHGASWNFVIWGGYHGALLILYRVFGRTWDAIPAPLRQAGMFILVLVGWVFFRATNLPMAVSLLSRMIVPTTGELVPNAAAFAAFAALGLWLGMAGPNAFDLHRQDQVSWRRAYALSAAFGICIAMMAGNAASPFLYFQF